MRLLRAFCTCYSVRVYSTRGADSIVYILLQFDMKTYDEADEIMILFEEIRLELLQEGKFCYFSFQAIQRKLMYKQEHKVSWQIRSVS